MSKFKPGDRVKLRGFGDCFGELVYVEQSVGRITKLLVDDTVMVKCDDRESEVRVFPSQIKCRLKPRREWWMCTYNKGTYGCLHHTKEGADACPGGNKEHVLLLREVRAKK